MSFVGDVPVASERWQDDRFYGSHFLNGCNPDTIKRCTELPANFPVTQELVGNLLDESDTLEKAMKVRKCINSHTKLGVIYISYPGCRKHLHGSVKTILEIFTWCVPQSCGTQRTSVMAAIFVYQTKEVNRQTLDKLLFSNQETMQITYFR